MALFKCEKYQTLEKLDQLLVLPLHVRQILGPFIREEIRRALHKTRTARINGTKQAFASYFRRDFHKTRLILEQNFWLFLFCPRLK